AGLLSHDEMVGVAQRALDQVGDLGWGDEGVLIGAMLPEVVVPPDWQAEHLAYRQSGVVRLCLGAGEQGLGLEAGELGGQHDRRLAPFARQRPLRARNIWRDLRLAMLDQDQPRPQAGRPIRLISHSSSTPSLAFTSARTASPRP